MQMVNFRQNNPVSGNNDSIPSEGNNANSSTGTSHIDTTVRE